MSTVTEIVDNISDRRGVMLECKISLISVICKMVIHMQKAPLHFLDMACIGFQGESQCWAGGRGDFWPTILLDYWWLIKVLLLIAPVCV